MSPLSRPAIDVPWCNCHEDDVYGGYVPAAAFMESGDGDDDDDDGDYDYAPAA